MLNRKRLIAWALPAALLVLGGCSITASKSEDGEKDKKVAIETPLGDLNVRTDEVSADDVGLALYPGARPKPKTPTEDKQAKVNIDTPWFGLKVVAVTFEVEADPEKVWEFYKKEMGRYGRVLECRPGSPDLDYKKADKDDLTCHDDSDDKGRVRIGNKDEELRVGMRDNLRIVAIEKKGAVTEFVLVHVVTREGKSDPI